MLYQQLDMEIAQRQAWSLRRQRNIPNNRRLWVLTCMDERVPIEQAIGIRAGDAHVFRNAGGLVTDDAVRSAMLTTQFFGTREIIVVNHTECGMMSAAADDLCDALQQRGIDLANVPIDPALPKLRLEQGAFAEWIRMFDDVDEICGQQVELLRSSPLIPDDVVVHGYVWEVETMRLRKPHERVGERVNTARQMRSPE